MDRNAELFKAAYYADLNTIKKLVKTKKDLQVDIPFNDGGYAMYWNSSCVSISLIEILNWAAYGFYEHVEDTTICHRMFDANDVQVLNDCINPSEYYQRVIDSIEWICNKFSIANYQLKNYSYYSPLSRVYFDDETYLCDDEISEALQKGFRQIDLDLINVAMKGNGVACYELVKKGADYKIDPLDYSDSSLIVDVLGTDNAFHMLRVISYLCHKERFKINDFYSMLSSLYQVGVGNYIIDIVKLNENK